MKVEHQIRSFEQIFKAYDGTQPLHRFLFAYFKQNKNMGSSDRRWATRYIYSFFRLGKALPDEPLIQRLAIGDFLCNQTPSLIVEAFLPGLNNKINESVVEKLALINNAYPSFSLADVFKFTEPISETILKRSFNESFFTQPDLFIRVRAQEVPRVVSALTAAQMPFEQVENKTIALPNGTKLEQALSADIGYQVQDLSSQKTGSYFQPEKYDYWWDCCAASGGKSLLLYDLEPQIQLLVSDVRENSLNNLQERFLGAGLKKYQIKVLDLLQNNEQDLHHYEFDGIILDAPCTGSGTWGRTPEMLYYFDEHRVGYFAKLQRSIAANVIKYLKPGKPLVYITCSVFKQENEDTVNWLLENLPLRLDNMEIIEGYDLKADTMFAARLVKK